MGSEIPPEVRAMTYDDRIRWHTKRIEREVPVYEFLESIQSDLEYDEVAETLSEVKLRITTVEQQISVLEYNDGEYSKILNEIHYCTAMARNLVGVSRETYVNKLIEWEAKLRDICVTLGIDVTPHLRSLEFRK